MIIEDIRNGILDCNDQESFVSILIKGLLINLNKDIKIRDIPVPHITMNLGDDLFFLKRKGYDASKEPLENTNENYIYNTIPRCMVNVGGIDALPDQLSSPYSRGKFVFENNNEIHTISAEFRRMPMKILFDLKYYTDSYTDMLNLIQQILSKMMFIRTFNITYLGQVIKCSYNVAGSFQDEHTLEFSGDMSEAVQKNMQLSIEVETNMPIINNKSAMDASVVITNCDKARHGSTYTIKNTNGLL